MKKALGNTNVDEKVFDRQVAIISSMTKKERTKPELLNASRRKRIATGSGTQVSEINKLIKQHRQMASMMKKMSRGKGGIGGALGGMFGGGMGGMGAMGGAGMPDLSNMDPAELEHMAHEMGIDPGSLAQGNPKTLTDKLPKDFSQLAKNTGLPELGKPQFPDLPGLGSGPIRKK
jgi:signal recognition particle subunit SRP54